MDKAQAETWIREICGDLYVLALPRLILARRLTGFYRLNRIFMSLQSRRDPHNTLIHELAHHVRYIKMGGAPRKGRRVQRHGEDFYRALLLVSEAAERRYGWEYNWMSEYPTIRLRRIFDMKAYARRLEYLKSLPQPSVAEEVEV